MDDDLTQAAWHDWYMEAERLDEDLKKLRKDLDEWTISSKPMTQHKNFTGNERND